MERKQTLAIRGSEVKSLIYYLELSDYNLAECCFICKMDSILTYSYLTGCVCVCVCARTHTMQLSGS